MLQFRGTHGVNTIPKSRPKKGFWYTDFPQLGHLRRFFTIMSKARMGIHSRRISALFNAIANRPIPKNMAIPHVTQRCAFERKLIQMVPSYGPGVKSEGSSTFIQEINLVALIEPPGIPGP